MVTISITREAFAAIEATLSKGSKAEARPDGKADCSSSLTAARSIFWAGCAVLANRIPTLSCESRRLMASDFDRTT